MPGVVIVVVVAFGLAIVGGLAVDDTPVAPPTAADAKPKPLSFAQELLKLHADAQPERNAAVAMHHAKGRKMIDEELVNIKSKCRAAAIMHNEPIKHGIVLDKDMSGIGYNKMTDRESEDFTNAMVAYLKSEVTKLGFSESQIQLSAKSQCQPSWACLLSDHGPDHWPQALHMHLRLDWWNLVEESISARQYPDAARLATGAAGAGVGGGEPMDLASLLGGGKPKARAEGKEDHKEILMSLLRGGGKAAAAGKSAQQQKMEALLGGGGAKAAGGEEEMDLMSMLRSGGREPMDLASLLASGGRGRTRD